MRLPANIQGDLSRKTNKIKDTITAIASHRIEQQNHESRLRARVLELELEKKKEKEGSSRSHQNVPSRAAERPSAVVVLDGLQEKLLDAANGALANFVTAPQLMHLGIPQMWLEQGADLERDVLPTLKVVAAKHKQRKSSRPIRSWDYFSSAVSDAKSARENGLPAPTLGMESPAESVRKFFRNMKEKGGEKS